MRNKATDINSGNNILEILLDKNNKDPITLVDEKGQRTDFKQIAIIPYKINDRLEVFAILAPITSIPGVKDDEALVFRVCEEDDKTFIVVETDEKLTEAIFDEYYLLLASN